MSEVYAYSNQDAEAVSNDINQIVSALEATLDEMDGEARKLGSVWEGSEQEEYQGFHGKWSQAAQQSRGVLAQVRASLDENTQSVAETRQRASQAIAGE